MKLSELKSVLRTHADAHSRFLLPRGEAIPQHFHVTEVGHVTKRFIDCGGKLHDRTETCLLQTHVADDVEHRLTAGTFARILDLGAQVLPNDQMDVEVEYEDGAFTQSPITSVQFTGGHIELQLGEKHTDCLARQKCGIDGNDCGTADKASAPDAVTCC